MNQPENLLFVFHDFEDTTPDAAVRRDEWPLHLTVTPLGFVLDDVPQERALSTITQLAEEALPIEIVPGEEALFGPDFDIPVTKIVDRTGELHHFHNQLIHELGALGCRFTDLSYALDNYSPHVSHKPGAPIIPDANYTVRSMSLAAKHPGPKPNKSVLKRIEF